MDFTTLANMVFARVFFVGSLSSFGVGSLGTHFTTGIRAFLIFYL